MEEIARADESLEFSNTKNSSGEGLDFFEGVFFEGMSPGKAHLFLRVSISYSSVS